MWLLAGFALAADLAVRKWAWPQVLYGLWLLVLLKLVTPPVFTSPVDFSSVLRGSAGEGEPPAELFVPGEYAPESHTVAPSPISAPDEPSTQPTSAVTVSNRNVPEAPGARTSASDRATREPAETVPWQLHILGLWRAGVVVLGTMIAHRFVAARSLHELDDSPPEWLRAEMKRAALRMGLRKAPALAVLDALGSAAVLGIVRPTVVVPREVPRDEAFHAGEPIPETLLRDLEICLGRALPLEMVATRELMVNGMKSHGQRELARQALEYGLIEPRHGIDLERYARVAAQQGVVCDIMEMDEPPTPLRLRPQIVLPPQFRYESYALHSAGLVVHENGRVMDVTLRQIATPASSRITTFRTIPRGELSNELRDTVIQQARRLRFLPATRYGVPVRCEVQVPIAVGGS